MQIASRLRYSVRTMRGIADSLEFPESIDESIFGMRSLPPGTHVIIFEKDSVAEREFIIAEDGSRQLQFEQNTGWRSAVVKMLSSFWVL